MRQFIVVLLASLNIALCTAPLAASAHFSSSMFEHSSEAQKEIGDFPLRARGIHGNLFLGVNDKLYKPVNGDNQFIANHWQVGDTIRVLRTRKKHYYMLANLNNGELIETKMTIHVKRATGDFPVVGRVKNKTFLLGNNVFYHPDGSSNRDVARTWQLSDEIRVLKIKHRHRRLLVNLTKQDIIEANIANIESSSF